MFKKMNRIMDFLLRLIIFAGILWLLVWSAQKVWQGYTFEEDYLGFPYEYMRQDCSAKECVNVYNFTNLAIDIGIILSASLIITWWSYRVKGKLY